jgi:hypothetical protein
LLPPEGFRDFKEFSMRQAILLATAWGVLTAWTSPAAAISLKQPLRVAVLVRSDSSLGKAVLKTQQTAVVAREAKTGNFYTTRAAKFTGLFGAQINLDASQQQQAIEGLAYSPIKLPPGARLSQFRLLEEHPGLRDPVTGKYGTYLEVGLVVEIGNATQRQEVVRQFQQHVRKETQQAQRQAAAHQQVQHQTAPRSTIVNPPPRSTIVNPPPRSPATGSTPPPRLGAVEAASRPAHPSTTTSRTTVARPVAASTPSVQKK